MSSVHARFEVIVDEALRLVVGCPCEMTHDVDTSPIDCRGLSPIVGSCVSSCPVTASSPGDGSLGAFGLAGALPTDTSLLSIIRVAISFTMFDLALLGLWPCNRVHL